MNQRRIGKYELQERLEQGGVGEVWKAFNPQQRRYVAIKIIPVDAQTSADFTPRFYREAEILAALHHPNIVAIQDSRMSQSGSEAYIIMDYVEGPSLANYLGSTAHQGKIPPPAEIVHLLAPIAAALDYAHQHDVIHGALRPAAILLDQASTTSSAPGEPKLTDFGLHPTQNPLALPLSDVPYIAPEVAQGFAGTKRSDLYALGAILYEMCTGTLPFDGDTPSDILMQSIHGVPNSPALINPHILPALTAVIMRSLAKDPAARYPSATALVIAVARALGVSIPESLRHAQPSLPLSNPPSQSGISSFLDRTNDPTYLSQPPQQLLSKTPSVPPIGAGSNTPAQLRSPVISPATPVFSAPLTGPAPAMQTSASTEMDEPTVLTSPPRAPVQVLSSPTPVPPARKRRRGRIYIALVAVVLVVLVASAVVAYLFLRGPSSSQSTIVGHAFFASSGQLGLGSDNSSNKGIADILQINLQNLSDPQPGKGYYAWLLDDTSSLTAPPILLDPAGPLPLNHGQVTMTYADAQHTNLLANYDRFLVTEEDANAPPLLPSRDAQRYSAVFSTMPNPTDTAHQYSLFEHLQHLLAVDPKIDPLGLKGGLDIWLFRNTTKVLEAAGGARDSLKPCTQAPSDANCGFVRRELGRILYYLDGCDYVVADVGLDISQSLPLCPPLALVGLLKLSGVTQAPPAYLEHIGGHLQELLSSPGSTDAQRVLATRITRAVNNANSRLKQVHDYVKQLLQMSNTDLSHASSTLNDLFTQANYAFVGQFDPNTNTTNEGIVDIHYYIQQLATFEVTACTISNGKSTCS